MSRVLAYLLAAAALGVPGNAEERRSWSKIRYLGGTPAVKTSPYDWNTNLTISLNPNWIVLTIAPARAFTPLHTLRIPAADITSLNLGAAAWRRVAEVSGAKLTAKPPVLFGLLQDRGFLGIVYQTQDGKRGAVLLESYFVWQMVTALKAATGKSVEASR